MMIGYYSLSSHGWIDGLKRVVCWCKVDDQRVSKWKKESKEGMIWLGRIYIWERENAQTEKWKKEPQTTDIRKVSIMICQNWVGIL